MTKNEKQLVEISRRELEQIYSSLRGVWANLDERIEQARGDDSRASRLLGEVIRVGRARDAIFEAIKVLDFSAPLP